MKEEMGICVNPYCNNKPIAPGWLHCYEHAETKRELQAKIMRRFN